MKDAREEGGMGEREGKGWLDAWVWLSAEEGTVTWNCRYERLQV